VEAGGDKLDGGLWAPGEPVDQLKNLISGLKSDPHGRRHIISAWNPGELDQMALPPCHMMAQFYVNSENELSCQMYQRSADLFLGVPFNIASYALLLEMVAQVTGKKADRLILALGDTHIYKDHFAQVREQLSREPRSLPTLSIKRKVDSIDDFKMDDFELVGYDPHPAIKATMSA
jgi:thymidylate synthase